MDKLVYSLATDKDIPFICKTYNENIDALHGVYRNEDVWQKLLADKDSAYYIVFADAPVAWFRTETEDGALWIGMLQVAPSFQRKGIGTYIISIVEKIAKTQGFSTVGIHTTEDNTAARALYVSAGYTITEIGPCTTADGIDRIGYTFQKDLLRQ